MGMEKISKTKEMGILLIIISILSEKEVYLQTYGITYLNVKDTIFNAYTVYYFTIYDSELITKNGTITIGFDSDIYNLPPNISCYNNLTTSPCSVVDNSFVEIAFTAFGYPFFGVGLSMIQNPSIQQSLDFSYRFTNFQPIIYSIPPDFFVPDTRLSCSLSFWPPTVSVTSTAIFTIRTKNMVDSKGMIKVTLPQYWPYAYTSIFPPVINGSISCLNISVVPVGQSTPCTVDNRDIYFSSLFSIYQNVVPENTTFVFALTNISTPPTTWAFNFVVVSTLMSNGAVVDTSFSCDSVGLQPQTIMPFAFSRFVVGEEGELLVSWISKAPFSTNYTVTLTLPDSASFYNDSAPILELDPEHSVVSSWVSHQTSSEISFFLGNYQDIPSGSNLFLSNLFVNCSIDTSPRNILLQVTMGNGLVESGLMEITPFPNDIQFGGISIDVMTLSTPMTLSINFTTTNSLDNKATLMVHIPTSIGLTGIPPLCALSSLGAQHAILPSISCNFDNSTNYLTVTSFIDTSVQILYPSSFILQIAKSFTTPANYLPSPTALYICTNSSGGYLVDLSINITFSIPPSTTMNVTVTSSSLEVGALSTYTLQYYLIRIITQGADILVILPPQILIPKQGQLQCSYSVNNIPFVSTYPTINLINSTLRFTDIITSDFPPNTDIKIAISSLINPRSFQPSSSFSVQISDHGYPIESMAKGMTVTMSIMAKFKDITPMVIGPKNGATQNYTFFIKPSIVINASHVIVAHLIDTTNGSNPLFFTPMASFCYISNYSNPCTATPNNLTITLKFPMSDTSGATAYQLSVSSVIMGRTFGSSSNFSFVSKTDRGYQVQELMVRAIENTVPNYIKSLKLTVLNQNVQLNMLVQMQFNITTFNGLNLLNGDFLVIQIPTSFMFFGNTSTPICTDGLFICSFSTNFRNNSVVVTPSAEYSQIGLVSTFVVTFTNNYLSPLNFDFQDLSKMGERFNVSTFTRDVFPIDITNSSAVSQSLATFYTTCGGKCQTCMDSNISYCLSCYIATNGSGSPVTNVPFTFQLMTADHLCANFCSPGQYRNPETPNCLMCQVPCSLCLSDTVCLNCVSGFYQMDSLDSDIQFVIESPDGYQNQAGKCQGVAIGSQKDMLNRVAPFSFVLFYAFILVLSVVMKCLSRETILASIIMSFGSVAEVSSVASLVIVGYLQLFTIGVIILLAALLLVYFCNFVCLALLLYALRTDKEFMEYYRKRIYTNIVMAVLSTLTHYKLHKIVYSDMFRMGALVSTTGSIIKLQHFKIMLIVSLILAAVEIVGVSKIVSQVYQSRLTNSTFVSAVGCIAVVVLNVAATVWVLRKKCHDNQQRNIQNESINKKDDSSNLSIMKSYSKGVILSADQ